MSFPRYPDPQRLRRAAPALAGFCAGVLGTLVLATFASVVYSGTGIGQEPPQRPPVYSVL